jgi:hypothetical protein
VTMILGRLWLRGATLLAASAVAAARAFVQ